MMHDKTRLYDERFLSACKQGRVEKVKHYIEVKFKNLPKETLKEKITKGVISNALVNISTSNHIETFNYLNQLYQGNVKDILHYRESLITSIAYMKNFHLIYHLLNLNIIQNKEDISNGISYLVYAKDNEPILKKLLEKKIIEPNDVFKHRNGQSFNILEALIERRNFSLIEHIHQHYITDLSQNINHYISLTKDSDDKLKLETILLENSLNEESLAPVKKYKI